MKLLDRGAGGAAIDYYGVSYHGQASTRLDALCHVWNEDGMWNGRQPPTRSASTARASAR